MLKTWIGLLTMAGLCALLTSAPAEANLLADDGFEAGINPLPGLAHVVGPPFQPGFWGAELGGEVTAERGCFPLNYYMLYMENEGLTVTQAFQAVDVSSFASLIDSGNAVAALHAYYTGQEHLAGLTIVPGLLFFADANDWPNALGSAFMSATLDSDPLTWEGYMLTAGVPAGTRWIVAQLGFLDSTLPYGMRGYAEWSSLEIVPVPEPATLALLPVLLSVLRRRPA